MIESGIFIKKNKKKVNICKPSCDITNALRTLK